MARHGIPQCFPGLDEALPALLRWKLKVRNIRKGLQSRRYPLGTQALVREHLQQLVQGIYIQQKLIGFFVPYSHHIFPHGALLFRRRRDGRAFRRAGANVFQAGAMSRIALHQHMIGLSCLGLAGERDIMVLFVHRAHGTAIHIVELLAAHLAQQHNAPALAAFRQGNIRAEPPVFPACTPCLSLRIGAERPALRRFRPQPVKGSKSFHRRFQYRGIQMAAQFLHPGPLPLPELAA